MSTQHDDTDELDRARPIGSANDESQPTDWSAGSGLWVSGSGVWPAGADESTSGGDRAAPGGTRRTSPQARARGMDNSALDNSALNNSALNNSAESDSNPLHSPLLRAFFTADVDTTWNDIQALPRLSDAPLGAHELRRDGLGGVYDAPKDRGPRVDLSHTLNTSRRLDRVRWNVVAVARAALAAISIAILVLGLGLLTWALLSPADGESTQPPELIAAAARLATT